MKISKPHKAIDMNHDDIILRATSKFKFHVRGG